MLLLNLIEGEEKKKEEEEEEKRLLDPTKTL